MSDECDNNCETCTKTETCMDVKKKQILEQERLKLNISRIKHKIAIISGKGGVGKSTVTVNLAMAFALNDYIDSVGILDADLHGPCVPKMLGLHGQRLPVGPAGIFPVKGPMGIKVVSMDFLLENDEDPVIWRGPLKMGAIKQFLSDMRWGELDFLFIDLPPGTGDEPLSVMQLIPDLDGVIIVTIPSEISQIVVKKAVTFARQLEIPIIGIIENMSGYVCPHCGTESNIFKTGGGRKIADDLSVPFLGSIPIDPAICSDSDEGVPFIIKHRDSASTKAFTKIVKEIECFLDQKRLEITTEPRLHTQEIEK
ncbi:MAG: ATP-binding protein involved in chromosome partitioning [Thermoproteota archaeon]|nr:ATP-binding protein involved in chromosome partitioning [Thermoproteota archaeon]